MGAFVCESVRLSQVGQHGLIHADCTMATIITELSWSSIRCVVVCCYFVSGVRVGGAFAMRCLYSAVNHVRKWCFIRMIYYCCCCFFSLWGSSPTAVKDTLFLLFIHLWVSLDVVSTVLITDGKLWLSLLVLLTDVIACLTHRCHCLSYSQMSLLVLLTDVIACLNHRREHLTPEDVQKNKAIMENIGRGSWENNQVNAV